MSREAPRDWPRSSAGSRPLSVNLAAFWPARDLARELATVAPPLGARGNEAFIWWRPIQQEHQMWGMWSNASVVWIKGPMGNWDRLGVVGGQRTERDVEDGEDTMGLHV